MKGNENLFASYYTELLLYANQKIYEQGYITKESFQKAKGAILSSHFIPSTGGMPNEPLPDTQ